MTQRLLPVERAFIIIEESLLQLLPIMVNLNSLLFSAIVGVATARYGVDLSVATDESTWKCLMSEHNTTYAFLRVYRSVGQLDANAIDSIKSAWSAGLLNLHAYIFPCVSTSPYSIENGITCDSPADQIKKSVSFLEDNGIHVMRQNETPSSAAVNVRRIWLDIEGIMQFHFSFCQPSSRIFQMNSRANILTQTSRSTKICLQK